MASQVYSTEHTKKNIHWPFSNSSKRLKRKDHSQISSMKPPSPDTKARHEGCRKRKNVAVLPSKVPDKPNGITINQTEIWPCHLASDKPSLLFTLGSDLLT